MESIGPIFIPVAGIMAAIPYISAGISHVMRFAWRSMEQINGNIHIPMGIRAVG